MNYKRREPKNGNACMVMILNHLRTTRQERGSPGASAQGEADPSGPIPTDCPKD